MKRLGRAILTALLCALLVGFGVCGAYGTFGGLSGALGGPGEGRALFPLLLGCGLAGLAIAWLCWRAIAALWRRRPDA